MTLDSRRSSSKRAQIFSNVIVIADERYPQTVGQTPKNDSKRKPGTTFEEIGAQFANAQPAMDVGMTEGAAYLKQPEENCGALAFW